MTINDDIVINNPVSALRYLHQLAKMSHVRYPVILQGDDDFLLSLFRAIPSLTLVSDTLNYDSSITWAQTKQMLGQDIGSLALDIRTRFDVEKLCLISGCITGGELLLLLVPDKDSNILSRFKARFARFYYHKSASLICQSGEGHLSRLILPASNTSMCSPSFVTADQLIAIDAVKHVLSGHRRRPLLLVSDRGRGKSSAMGMAAGKIMTCAKKRILVTSPLFAHVDLLFMHTLNAGQMTREAPFTLRGTNGSELQFIAPDRLLNEDHPCDLLLVDEAAAIPLPMLSDILRRYSRVVFSSTEHGYEGSGRAFSLRFRSLLNAHAKGWKEVKLETPVRWALDDPLEKWLFDAFLFDAEPSIINNVANLTLRHLTQDKLFADERLLKEVFSLLVTAHYQTSPNDLIMLLDEGSQVLLGAYSEDQLVGVLLAQLEGGFDEITAKAVVDGKRRLKGHLLAQSIASHSGVVEALTSSLFRIVRIAVHPDCRNQGVGRMLVRAIEAHAKQNGILVLGTSFGVTQDLWRFWHSLGYLSVRLGVQRDAASGTFSLQLLTSLSDMSDMPDWFSDLLSLFSLNFIHQLPRLFQEIDPDIAVSLISQCHQTLAPRKMAMQQIRLFAKGALGYDLVLGSLHTWFLHWLVTSPQMQSNNSGCHLFVALLLQGKSWGSVAKQFGFNGRKDTEKAMRHWLTSALKEE